MVKKRKSSIIVFVIFCLGIVLGITVTIYTPVVWSHILRKKSVFISLGGDETQYIISKKHEGYKLLTDQFSLESNDNSTVYQSLSRKKTGGLQTLYFEMIRGDVTKLALFDEASPKGAIGIWRVISTIDKHSLENSSSNGLVYDLLLEEIDPSVNTKELNKSKVSLIIEQ